MKLVYDRLLIDVHVHSLFRMIQQIGSGDIGDSDFYQTNIDIFQTSLER